MRGHGIYPVMLGEPHAMEAMGLGVARRDKGVVERLDGGSPDGYRDLFDEGQFDQENTFFPGGIASRGSPRSFCGAGRKGAFCGT